MKTSRKRPALRRKPPTRPKKPTSPTPSKPNRLVGALRIAEIIIRIIAIWLAIHTVDVTRGYSPPNPITFAC